MGAIGHGMETSKHDVIFTVGACVRVELRTRGSGGLTLVDDLGFIKRFRDYCEEIGVYYLRGMTTGPGIFSADLAWTKATSTDVLERKIMKWLADNGAEEAE